MIDFKGMKFGAILHDDGIVIVVDGTFIGPFNEKQAKEIRNLLVSLNEPIRKREE